MKHPEDPEIVAKLANTFEAARLGHGDPDAGMNLLAAKAITIANLCGPDAAVWTDGLGNLPVGGSFVVCGPHSSSLVSAGVLGPLETLQKNLSANVIAYWKDRMHQDTLPVHVRKPESKDLFRDDEELAMHTVLKGWVSPTSMAPVSLLIQGREEHARTDLLEDPCLYITTADPAKLMKAVTRSHRGSPMVHVPVSSAQNCTGMQYIMSQIIGGHDTGGVMSKHIRGHFVATIAPAVLTQVASGPGGSEMWINRGLMLTDHDQAPSVAGDELPPWRDAPFRYASDFERALVAAWEQRLDFRKPGVLNPTFACENEQMAMVRFLKDCEKSSPGVTAACGSLFATLLFGLSHMIVPMSETVKARLPALVAAFTRHLIRRMMFARAQMTRSDQDIRVKRLALAIADRLLDNPSDVRSLTRRFHRLDAESCRDALELLLEAGCVTRTGDTWTLVEAPAAVEGKLGHTHYLDV